MNFSKISASLLGVPFFTIFELFFSSGYNKKMKKIKDQQDIISWQAPEFEYQPKDVSWYWLSIIAAIFLVILAIWHKNFLFAIFIVVAELVVVSFAGRFPVVWEFKINDKGIGISKPNKEEGKFYLYKDLLSFDIHPAGEEYKELIIKLESKLKPLLKINIHSADEEKIKDFLLKFLPQEEISASAIDSVSKLIRF